MNSLRRFELARIELN